MRSNDCCRPRTLASSFMTNAGPAARAANTRRISIRSQMMPSLPCGKRNELLVRDAQGSDIRAAVREAGFAPLAATRAPVDFVIVCFGLAVSVIDEDQEEVALEMRLKGHSQEEISKALEVASAAEAVFESGFSKGFERFDALKPMTVMSLVQRLTWQLYAFHFACTQRRRYARRERILSSARIPLRPDANPSRRRSATVVDPRRRRPRSA